MTVKGGQQPGQLGVTILVKDVVAAADFYTSVLGAVEIHRHALRRDDRLPAGTVTGIELRLGDAHFIVALENPWWADGPAGWPRSPVSAGTTTTFFTLYVDDVDATVARALAAGARPRNQDPPVQDSHWGDRVGQFIDPSGHLWRLLTAQEEVEFAALPARLEALLQAERQRRAAARSTATD